MKFTIAFLFLTVISLQAHSVLRDENPEMHKALKIWESDTRAPLMSPDNCQDCDIYDKTVSRGDVEQAMHHVSHVCGNTDLKSEKCGNSKDQKANRRIK